MLKSSTSSLLDDEESVNKKPMASFDAINNSEVIPVADKIEIEGPATDRFKGIVCVVLASISFALMVVACKLAYQNNPHLTGFDYVLLRASSMSLMSALQVGYLRLNPFDVKKGYRMKLFWRCIIGGVGMPSFFMGLKYIPSSKATLIFNIHPLLVAVLGFYLLNEQITKVKIIAVIGSFIGVVLFTLSKSDSTENADDYYLGIGLVSFACLCGTTVALLLRVINQHVHYAMSPFWFGVTTLGEALIVLLIFPSLYNFSHYTTYDCSLFLISGVFNYIGQTLKSLAFKYEEASFITPFGYLQVLYLFICDLIIFGYSFSTTDILGSILIAICLLAPVLQRMYVHRVSKPLLSEN